MFLKINLTKKFFTFFVFNSFNELFLELIYLHLLIAKHTNTLEQILVKNPTQFDMILSLQGSFRPSKIF